MIERSIQHSFCLGIYRLGRQVAFARLVTDKATFAWVCDVFVDENFRKQGLGKWLIETACSYVDQKGIEQTLLATRDAQGFYFVYGGFQHLSSPEFYMHRKIKDVE